MKSQLTLEDGSDRQKVIVEDAGGGSYRVTVGEQLVLVDARSTGPGQYHLLLGQDGHDLLVEHSSGAIRVHVAGIAVAVPLLTEVQAARAAIQAGPRRTADGAFAVRAPMPGKVVKLLVAEGDVVEEGQGVIVIEAMKMENELRAAVAGTVMKIRVAEGDSVESGEDLLLIE